MSRALLLIVVLCTTACQHEEEYEFNIDPLLLPYYDAFVHEAEQRGVKVIRENLVMKFQDGLRSGEFNANGIYQKHDGQRFIYIDTDWITIRGAKVQSTVFHELGHAILKREHNTEYSLMNPKVSGTDEAWPSCDSCQVKLIDELFNPAY